MVWKQWNPPEQIPTHRPPHKSHLQAGGTCNLHILSQACQEGNSGGYSCSGSCPVQSFPGRLCGVKIPEDVLQAPQKEMRPDLPMLK